MSKIYTIYENVGYEEKPSSIRDLAKNYKIGVFVSSLGLSSAICPLYFWYSSFLTIIGILIIVNSRKYQNKIVVKDIIYSTLLGVLMGLIIVKFTIFLSSDLFKMIIITNLNLN
jgi:hypothetical protein